MQHHHLNDPAQARPARRLSTGDAHELRELLHAEVDGVSTPGDAPLLIRRVATRAREGGLSITDLILEVKSAWNAIPIAARTRDPGTSAVLDRAVTHCIEEYYGPRR